VTSVTEGRKISWLTSRVSARGSTDTWVILITEGTVVLQPPEIYVQGVQAADEAERWAWLLAEGVPDRIRKPFAGRWQVADRDVRLVESPSRLDRLERSPWVGTFWTADGAPDPEAIILGTREDARQWVTEALPTGHKPLTVVERPWMISATWVEGGEESYAVAHRGKLVAEGVDDSASWNVNYEVEIVGRFVHSIRSIVSGPPGLDRRAIEELIDRNWALISADVDVLLESEWELEEFRPLGEG
jgi:hypothetical protein